MAGPATATGVIGGATRMDVRTAGLVRLLDMLYGEGTWGNLTTGLREQLLEGKDLRRFIRSISHVFRTEGVLAEGEGQALVSAFASANPTERAMADELNVLQRKATATGKAIPQTWRTGYAKLDPKIPGKQGGLPRITENVQVAIR